MLLSEGDQFVISASLSWAAAVLACTADHEKASGKHLAAVNHSAFASECRRLGGATQARKISLTDQDRVVIEAALQWAAMEYSKLAKLERDAGRAPRRWAACSSECARLADLFRKTR